MKTHKKARYILGGILVLFMLQAGSCGGDKSSAEKAAEQGEKETGDQMKVLVDAQPALRVPYSQVRQTLIVAEWLAATGAATHTFVINEFGGLDSECDSVGFPVPGTFNLTNPDVEDPNSREDAGIVVAQAEGTLGVFTGPTDGTWVICLTAAGKPYVTWNELHVQGGYPIGTYWDPDAIPHIVVPDDAVVAETPVEIIGG